MDELEKKNVVLGTEITTLQEQAGLAIGAQLELEMMDPRVDSLVGCLSLLECQDGDSIWIGTYTFTNVVDCKAFLLTKVPAKVLSAYCYDMVSLVH
jgi:hypothetical protein